MKKLRTRDEVLESITNDGRTLRFASFEFQDDEELVRLAIDNGGDLEYASFRLQNDTRMCDYFASHSRFDPIFERALFLLQRNPSTFKTRCGLFAENKEFILCAKIYHGSKFLSPIAKYNSYSHEKLVHELFNLRYAQVQKFYTLMKKTYSESAATEIHESPDLMYSLLRIPAMGAWFANAPFSSIKDSFEAMVDKCKSEQDYFCSSKGIGSFPERVTAAVLSQLNLPFDREKVFEWSEGDAKKAYKGRKRYDFYLPENNTIIEVHGAQHYEKGFEAIGGRTLKEEQKNDEQKHSLAIKNGITNYIVIDAHRSKFEFLRDSIRENKQFNDLYSTEQIDWSAVRSEALGADKSDMVFPYQKFRLEFYNDWIQVLEKFEQDHSGLAKSLLANLRRK